MDYNYLMFLHLYTVLPCFIIGTVLLIQKKGTKTHKFLGRIYMVLMLFTAMVTLLMPAKVGPQVLNHFGYLHLFSFLTLYTVPSAYAAIKRNDIKTHKRKMIILYFGALLIAGGFTLFPGRYLNNLLFH
jgi:uncharacterized membrane protein